MSSRKTQDILDPAYDLSDLEAIVAGTPTPRAIRDAVPKLSKLILEHTLKHGWTQIGRDGLPYIQTNRIKISSLAAIDEHGRPKLTTRPHYDREKDMIAVAPTYGATNTTTLHTPDSFLILENEVYSPPSCKPETLKITKFGETSGLFAHKVYISRRVAIDFLRNKRGGAHRIEWDIKQSNNKNLQEIHDILVRLNDPVESSMVEKYPNYRIMFGHINVLQLYIWNTVCDLVASPDVKSFLAQAQSEFGREYGYI